MQKNKPKYKPIVRPGKRIAEQKAHKVNATYRTDRLLQSQETGFKLHEYLQMNRHRHGCPPFLKGKWFDVLMRYVPGPLGLGMDAGAIAVDMRMHRSSIHRILVILKNKFSSAMARVESMRRMMKNQSGSMTKQNGMKSYDVLFDHVGMTDGRHKNGQVSVENGGGLPLLSEELIKDVF